MTVTKKVLPDGTEIDYEALPILCNEEYVASLRADKESTDIAFRKSQQTKAFVGYDEQGRQWISGQPHAPTWDEVVEGYQTIPVQEVYGHGKTHTYGPLRHWTRAEAEAKAAKACPWLVPVSPRENRNKES